VREHGGKIVVTSKPGQGSQFVVELPLRRSETGKGGTGTSEVQAVPE
jgi:chemotaxis protein histidine kinase CheA